MCNQNGRFREVACNSHHLIKLKIMLKTLRRGKTHYKTFCLRSPSTPTNTQKFNISTPGGLTPVAISTL